jgi:hypothetical protein
MDRLPPVWVARTLGVRRALSSLGGGKGYGRGAEGVGPSHRKEGDGELGKGFGAKQICDGLRFCATEATRPLLAVITVQRADTGRGPMTRNVPEGSV